jgi:hypothetical protein
MTQTTPGGSEPAPAGVALLHIPLLCHLPSRAHRAYRAIRTQCAALSKSDSRCRKTHHGSTTLTVLRREIQSRVTTGRTIVVRVRELESPDHADPLGLARSLAMETPLFLIDLNVLFDLAPHRARHDEAVTLFQAERANFCRLAISDEIIAELARTGPTGRPDPMMNLARTFTRFPVSNVDIDSPILRELGHLVFPHKAARSLSQNDVSDLRHLVTAIEVRRAVVVA